jgi:hypothetical protein
MNCTRVEKLLPLYVEGDLDAGRGDEVRQHLDACAPCRALAAGYEESQSWLRSHTPPDFDEAFFTDLRGAVRQKIARQQSQPAFFQWIAARWRWQPALVAVGALLLLISGLAVYLRSGDEKVAQPRDQIAVAQPSDTKGSASPQPEQPGGSGAGATVDPQPRDKASQPRRGIWRESLPDSKPNVEREALAQSLRPDTTNVAESKSAAAPETAARPAMLRIEIQTADPKIRIIWFAPKEASPPSAKNGTDSE